MVEHVLDVGRSGRPRANAGDETALLAQRIGRLVGVEHHRRVEVRERDDEADREDPVEPASAHRVGEGGHPTHRGKEHRELRGEVEDGTREDDGDDAGRVDFDGQVRGLTAHDATTHHALGILHRDAALAALDEDDERHDREDDHDHQHREDDAVGGGLQRLDDRRGQARHDVGKDDEAHAVADAALSDDLAHPHDEDGTRKHGHHDDDVHEDLGEARLREVDAETLALEQEEVAHGVQQGQANGEVARVLRHPALARLALARKRSEARHNGLEHLHDDLGRDVGHDAEAEHRHARQGAAAEQVEDGNGAVRAGARLICREHPLEGDARHGDICPDPVQHEDAHREQDLIPKLLHAKRVEDAF